MSRKTWCFWMDTKFFVGAGAKPWHSTLNLATHVSADFIQDIYNMNRQDYSADRGDSNAV